MLRFLTENCVPHHRGALPSSPARTFSFRSFYRLLSSKTSRRASRAHVYSWEQALFVGWRSEVGGESMDGREDLFVHQSSLKSDGYRSLNDGDVVEFEVSSDSDGRPKAIDVTAPGGGALQGGSRPDGGDRGYGGGGGGRGYGGGGGDRGYGGCGGDRGYGGGGGGYGGGGGDRGYGGGGGDRGYGGGGGGYGGGGGGGGGRGCYKCGEEGHIARECTSSGGGGGGYGGGGGGGGGGGRGCYNCGEEGHISRECPQKRY
ncbi:hypothetical protein PR202_ga00640 [Eleusine coracana subsp. coracana]|uniref:Uncharacterized protein n=1 Tax=Eleusine coracana subsp. coracana TaxID=191504 RepID=A0AAV5BG38_ELECO|nr:hypothetical protein PR202_ga00640 [Eleusine coracana subsp. coracana]